MTRTYAFSNAKAVDASGSVSLSVDVFDDGVISQSFGYYVSVDPFAEVQTAAQAYVAANPGEVTAYVPPTISQLRDQTTRRLVSMLDGMARLVLQKYPEAEQRLWKDFESEAKAFNLNDVEGNTLADFPTINAMLSTKLGAPADDSEAKSRIAAAAPGMLANAAGWRGIAAYIGGARARWDDAIDAAADESALNVIITSIEAEVAASKIAFGLA